MVASPSSMKPSTSVWNLCRVAAASTNSRLTLSRSATAALCTGQRGGSGVGKGHHCLGPVLSRPHLPTLPSWGGDGGTS